MLATDACGNDEDQDDREPKYSLEPAEGFERVCEEYTSSTRDDRTYQLRTLSPQKDTYPSLQSGKRGANDKAAH